MAKKIAISFSVVFAVVLAGLTFFLIAAEYSSDSSAPLEQAKAYETAGNYEQAESIYKTIVTDYPGTDEAFQAQKNLALLFIATRNHTAAQAEVDALIADFAEHPELPPAVYDIANHYWYRYRYQQARGLYKYIADKVPDSDFAMRAQAWITGSDFILRNYVDAWEGIDKLVKDFSGHPNLAKMIYALANNCWYASQYRQAQQLFKYIADNMPDSGLAFRAQAWVVGSDIRLWNFIAAKEGINTLITDFAENPELTGVIYQLANEYWYVQEYEDARRLYQRVLEGKPDSSIAMRAKAWIAGADLMAGNYAAGQEGIDKLIAEFPEHPQLLWTLNKMGQECESSYQNPLLKYEKAKSLYQMVIKQYPNSAEASKAQLYMRRADVLLLAYLENYAASEAAFDGLIADFNDHPDLPSVISEIGYRYYLNALREEYEGLEPKARDDFTKAITVWERIIQEFPKSNATPRAYCYSGDSYLRLREYEKAINCYQKLISVWPSDYEYAWKAQFFIGKCYKALRDSGSLPESEANPKIEQAYKAVVEKYTDSPAIRDASIGLGWLNFKRGQWVEAVDYFELSLKKSEENRKLAHILYPLGRAYEEIGHLDKAAQVYQEFIDMAYSRDSAERVKARLEKLQGENI